MKRGMRKVGYKKAFKAVSKVVSSVASFAAPFIPGANVLSAIGLGAEIFSGLQQRKYASKAADAAQRQFELSKYDLYAEDGALISSKHLNKRNTKLICEYIESVLDNDPYSFEFDEYELMQEEFDFNQEIIFNEKRLSNI